MKLKISGIFARGVPYQERLQITVLANTSLNYYVVFDTVYIGNTVSAAPKHVLWFNEYWVKAGDIVVLYTSPGKFSAEKRPDGGTNHFLYWGHQNTLWNHPDGCAVLLEINTWETSARG
jgi:hypothetical protein